MSNPAKILGLPSPKAAGVWPDGKLGTVRTFTIVG